MIIKLLLDHIGVRELRCRFDCYEHEFNIRFSRQTYTLCVFISVHRTRVLFFLGKSSPLRNIGNDFLLFLPH